MAWALPVEGEASHGGLTPTSKEENASIFQPKTYLNGITTSGTPLFTLLSSYLSSPEFTRSVHTGKLPERMVSIIFLLAAGKI